MQSLLKATVSSPQEENCRGGKAHTPFYIIMWQVMCRHHAQRPEPRTLAWINKTGVEKPWVIQITFHGPLLLSLERCKWLIILNLPYKGKGRGIQAPWIWFSMVCPTPSLASLSARFSAPALSDLILDVQCFHAASHTLVNHWFCKW